MRSDIGDEIAAVALFDGEGQFAVKIIDRNASEHVALFAANLAIIYHRQRKIRRADRAIYGRLELRRHFRHRAGVDEIIDGLSLLQSEEERVQGIEFGIDRLHAEIGDVITIDAD